MTYVAHYSDAEPTRAEVDARPGVTVLEFGADWCGHCIGAQRLIESTIGHRPEIAHIKVADGRGKPLGRSFAVKLWPTLVVLRDGVETARVVRPTAATELANALAR
jgi:thioredoxin 1